MNPKSGFESFTRRGEGQKDRIAILLPDLDCGGAQRVVLTLAESFVAIGADVEIVVARGGGPLESEIPSGVTLNKLSKVDQPGPMFPILALWRAARYLRENRPSAILSSITGANLIAVVARWFSGKHVKLVIRHENTAANVTSRVRALCMRLLYPLADAIVTVSAGAAADLHEGIGIPSASIHVIPNPIDPKRIRAMAAAEPAHPWLYSRETPLILAVGRLNPQKDFGTLLRAMAILSHKRRARLLILGEGPDRMSLQDLAHTLGVADFVSMPGVTGNPYSYMSAADVFVLSSLWEGMPVALLEAVALGCRIVSTDCHSGPSEILDDGRFGRLVPASDPEALASGILAALDSRHDPAFVMSRAEAFLPETAANQHATLLGLDCDKKPA